MSLSVRSRLWAGLAAGVLTVAASIAATSGAAQAASTPGPNTPETVPTGLLASSLPGASVFGSTSPSTPEQVSFILKERDISQLESSVTGGKTSYDSVSQFAGKYGQSSAVVSALTGYLAKFGITTSVYPGNVDVSASGTAGEFDQALAVKQQNYHVPARHGANRASDPAQTVYSATAAPELPYRLSQYVLAVLGLTNYAPFSSHAVHVNSTPTYSSASSADQPGSYLPSDFAANYGLKPVQAKANGSGETLGIVTLAALDVGAPEYFWQPGANISVYQAPNTDPGFIDGFFSAASQNVVDTLSSSWGESETYVAAAVAAGQETATYEASFDEAFLELADQGQSTFVSAGDAGAYDASEDLGSTNLSVDTPGDSPYVT